MKSKKISFQPNYRLRFKKEIKISHVIISNTFLVVQCHPVNRLRFLCICKYVYMYACIQVFYYSHTFVFLPRTVMKTKPYFHVAVKCCPVSVSFACFYIAQMSLWLWLCNFGNTNVCLNVIYMQILPFPSEFCFFVYF